ncbi:hypothetical protein ACIPID_08555, partial [Cupriavidus sp. CER94]|uniref:hypothetical protein n=1 Tax=Cupriavidus sp. CER94 TaxID=3377036 RepID=UPI00382FB827
MRVGKSLRVHFSNALRSRNGKTRLYMWRVFFCAVWQSTRQGQCARSRYGKSDPLEASFGIS